jgi:hypothetical protein
MAKLIRTLMLICLFTIALDGFCDTKYISIIDAGSSGSRIHLYKIGYDKQLTVSEIDLGKGSKIHPGIATLASTPDKVTDYINTLLNVLESSGHSDVPVYLYATAGMRTVSPFYQDSIYKAVRAVSEKIKDAKTIPGEKEGEFDWIAINFGPKPSVVVAGYKTTNDTTVGVMDMGGASMQVAYDAGAPGSSINKITIGNTVYNVYSRTYLGLGADDARYQFSDDADCFFRDFPMPDGGYGTGSFDKGLGKIHLLLKTLRGIEPIPSQILSKHQFAGIGAFFIIANYLKMGDPFTVDDIKSKGDQMSGTSWDPSSTNPYLFSDFFVAQYVTQTLTDLGFTTEKIQVQDASWAVGAAIYLRFNKYKQLQNAREGQDLMAVRLKWSSSM